MKTDEMLASHEFGKKHLAIAEGASDWYVIKPWAEYDNWIASKGPKQNLHDIVPNIPASDIKDTGGKWTTVKTGGKKHKR